MTEAPPDPLGARFERLLGEGELSAADARWLMAPHGLTAVCRQLVAAQALPHDAEAWAELCDKLDDRSPGGRSVARAEAIMAAALLAAGFGGAGERDLAARDLAPPGAEPAVGLAALDSLVAWLAGGPTAPPDAAVTILVSRFARGEAATLQVWRAGDETLAPNLVAAPFQRCDATFAQAVATAAAVVGCRGARWAVLSPRSNHPLDSVGGPSVGLGAALALRALESDLVIDPSWGVTGAVRPDGGTDSLLDERHDLDEYRAKLTAAAGRTVLVPAIDHAEVAAVAEAEAPDVRVLGAATVDEATEAMRRHLAGRGAYEQALAGALTRLRRWPWALAGAGLLVLVVGVVLGLRAKDVRASENEARAAARGSAARREAVGTPDEFDLQATEVTNGQWSRCAAVGKCRVPPAGVSDDESVAARSDFPVGNVTADEARSFCRWIGGDLPTFEQWVEASQSELERTDHELRVLPDITSKQDASSGWVIGNQAEWSRTSCESGQCATVEKGRLDRAVGILGLSWLSLARWKGPGSRQCDGTGCLGLVTAA
ncbi:MAG: SUMF1/EgtB/PvdO family nonheme iron enzyme [Acidimicrobiales bacterium]